MSLGNKRRKTNELQIRATTIFLMSVLALSVATISIVPRNTEATFHSELCQRLNVMCEDTTTPPPDDGTTTPPPDDGTMTTQSLTSGDKFYLATFLQYASRDGQVNIYRPNMDGEDQTRLRVQGDDTLKTDYISAAKSIPGEEGVEFKSSQEIIENARRVRNLGFDFIELNLERGLSPTWDNNNVVAAMKRAAKAAHDQGLEFRAAPSRAYTTQFGSQIAPFVDYYHIQAQALQDDGIKAYSDYVHQQVAKLKRANPDLIITVQVSTQQGNAPGLSLLETMKRCTNSVMDVADGVSVWFGNDDLRLLRSFVEWYTTKWS
ncbi:MAG: hypothetical protein M3115_03210 [Thermoproteota archaeon]|nr:hypothetical protein [Thermoproteota archaeon]